MANTPYPYTGGTADVVSITVNAGNDFFLPPGLTGKNNPVSRWVIQFVSASFVGTITMKSQQVGQVNQQLAVPYIGLNVNGTVGTGLPTTTGITGNSLIEIDATEQEIVLSTAYTSGSMTVTARLVQG